MSEGKFSKCEKGIKYEISGVWKKKGKKKKRKVLKEDIWVEFFAKFVFTGWAFCCETWLKLKNENCCWKQRKKMIACYGKI